MSGSKTLCHGVGHWWQVVEKQLQPAVGRQVALECAGTHSFLVQCQCKSSND
jgi:hypothetical protein